MFVLDSVACADTFPNDGQMGGAQIVAQNGSTGGYASVTGADVYVQLAYQPAPGSSLEWTPAVHVGPGNIILAAGTRGIRFRNYVAGKVATVSAGLSEPLEPPLQLTSAGVSSSGGTVSGTPLAYATFTAPVVLANVAEAVATVVVSAPSVTFDGLTTIIVRFAAVEFQNPAASTLSTLFLFDNGVSLGAVSRLQEPAAPVGSALTVFTDEIVPAAGPHVFSIRGTSNGGDGTVQAGVGGVGALRPGSIAVLAS